MADQSVQPSATGGSGIGGGGGSNLPFTIEYSSYPTRQINCQQNINVLPNGPIFPTKPIYPSALPPSLTSYPSTIQTNFINVRREACICNLSCSCLDIDAGFKNGTVIRFNNLPTPPQDLSKKYRILVIDEGSGQLFTIENPISTEELVNNLREEDRKNIGTIGSSTVRINDNLSKNFGLRAVNNNESLNFGSSLRSRNEPNSTITEDSCISELIDRFENSVGNFN